MHPASFVVVTPTSSPNLHIKYKTLMRLTPCNNQSTKIHHLSPDLTLQKILLMNHPQDEWWTLFYHPIHNMRYSFRTSFANILVSGILMISLNISFQSKKTPSHYPMPTTKPLKTLVNFPTSKIQNEILSQFHYPPTLVT